MYNVTNTTCRKQKSYFTKGNQIRHIYMGVDISSATKFLDFVINKLRTYTPNETDTRYILPRWSSTALL